MWAPKGVYTIDIIVCIEFDSLGCFGASISAAGRVGDRLTDNCLCDLGAVGNLSGLIWSTCAVWIQPVGFAPGPLWKSSNCLHYELLPSCSFFPIFVLLTMFIYLPYTLRFCVSGFLAYLTFDLPYKALLTFRAYLPLLAQARLVGHCNIAFILQRDRFDILNTWEFL